MSPVSGATRVIETVKLLRRQDMEENRSKEIFVAGAVLGTVSFVVTALRVFTRVKITQAWGADDGIIIPKSWYYISKR